MPIVKMDKVTVIGFHEQKDDIVDALMRLGAVELIEESDQGPDLSDFTSSVPSESESSGQADSLSQQNENSRIDEDLLFRIARAIEVTSRLQPVKKKMFSGRRTVDVAELFQIADREKELLDVVSRLEQNETRLVECRMQRGNLLAKRELLLPWISLDLDLSDPKTEYTQIFLGSYLSPGEVRQAENQLRENIWESHLEMISEDENGVRCAVVTLQTKADSVRGLLRQTGFNFLPDLDTAGTAADQIRQIDRALGEILHEIEEKEAENEELAQFGADLELLHDFLLIRHDRLKAAALLPSGRYTFWLQGWVPEHLVRSVEKGLTSRFLVAVSHEPAGPDEAYPILLRNNRLVKPYEVIVEMFSPPSTKEKDPTPLMAPFFFFFFGMMLSDVGYGFLLSAVCALAVFKFKVKGEMERLCRMLFLCGISSMIWGFLFGSFFGDMVSVLSQNRFNFKPLWFNPMDDAILLMIWSMIFGAVHLFAGMGAKAYILFQTGHGKDAILDIFPWYFIITGLGLMLGGYGSAGQIMAIAGAAVLILFSGRGTKNPIMRLFKGLFSLYDITGYFSDILSYTRILALVLATSVIAMVVNLLGFLGGPSITGFIFYVLVAILGHTLNLALSSLSAYVHTSRLQYVEFFSKFYEGGGRLWQPLKIKTKYVDLVRTQSDS